MTPILRLISIILLPWIIAFFALRHRLRFRLFAFSSILVVQLFGIAPVVYIASETIANMPPKQDLRLGAIYSNQIITQGQLHGLPGWEGVDITSGCGSPIYAPFDGTVTYVGLDGYNHVDERGVVWEQATMLTIQGNDGLELTLLHGDYSVIYGDKIDTGQQIGTEASHGWSTGCHSHVILKQNNQTLNFLSWQNQQAKPANITNGNSISGYLSAYGKEPTDATLKNRQEFGQIPHDLNGFDSYIAVLDCTKIGATGKLHTNIGTLKVLVFDCAGTEDGGAEWMVSGNYVAELDWYTWERYPEIVGTQAILVLDQ